MDYKTCEKSGFSEVTEKKSRFLGELVHVEDLAEAGDYISEVRKKYYDARHHCFAFICGEPGSPEEITRSGDDGEPQGTAGKPMLEVLTGAELHQTLVVVTRYFGGTLLGTGGLVRAYSAAARDALAAARIVTVRQGVKLSVACDYALYGRLQHLFSNEDLQITRTDFADNVRMELAVPSSELPRIEKLISDSSSGQAACRILGSCSLSV